MRYLRHTLCYLDNRTAITGEYSQSEMDLFQHWLSCQYPFIFTRQPITILNHQIQLAIPYFIPSSTKKIRAHFLIATSSVIKTTSLPHLSAIFPHVDCTTSTNIHVYGSYCWEYLTQEPYIRPNSDLDLLIIYENQSLFALKELHQHLQTTLNIHIDGEIRFPELGDCAWGELIQKSSSQFILFKSTKEITLLKRDRLYALFPTLRF